MTCAIVDEDSVSSVGSAISRIKIVPDSFTDPRYYPPPDVNVEIAVTYFMAVVAIDHRTSALGRFEGIVDGERFEGADLLWRLSKKMFDERPELFTPRGLADVDVDLVRRWLSVDWMTIWDYGVRAMLLRDIGRKLVHLYGGSSLRLLEESRGYLYSRGQGLIERLKVFRAYEDPVEKKPFLLVKFLTRRGYLKVFDVENLHVPVDNHLTRIAYRLGIVRVSDDVRKLIERGLEVGYELDVCLRLKVREAWKRVSIRAKIDPTVLDDLLWSLGRGICTRESPRCDICPLRDVCSAHRSGEYITEHIHQITWYY